MKSPELKSISPDRKVEPNGLFFNLLKKYKPDLRILGLAGLVTMLAACERGEQDLGKVYAQALKSEIRKVHIDMPNKNTQDLVGLRGGMQIQENAGRYFVLNDEPEVPQRVDVYGTDDNMAANKVIKNGITWSPAVVGPTVFHYRVKQGSVEGAMKSENVSREKDPMTEESFAIQSTVDLPEVLVNYVQNGGQFYVDGKKITKHKSSAPEDLEVRMVLLTPESQDVHIASFSQPIPSTPALPDSLLEQLISEGSVRSFVDTLTIDTEYDVTGGRRAITEHLAKIVSTQSKIESNPAQKDIYFGSALVTGMHFLQKDTSKDNLNQKHQKKIALRYVVSIKNK